METNEMRSVLKNLRESTKILDQMTKYGIEITDTDEEECVVFAPKGKNHKEDKKLVIRDVIEQLRPTTFPVLSDTLNVSIDADDFSTELARWKEAHRGAKIVSMTPCCQDKNRTSIKYQM